MTSMINWYRAALREARPDILDERKIQVPTLVIWGKQDAYLSSGMVQSSKDMCRDGTLKMFNDASRWVHQEYSNDISNLLFNHFRTN
jgi:epoxide hydrolase 4